ncbi:MAG: hypothetical protein FJ275_06170, partial [Planctomycetes bacterium]|nr:hypothetical protein [Planctomycetota bacterium]
MPVFTGRLLIDVAYGLEPCSPPRIRRGVHWLSAAVACVAAGCSAPAPVPPGSGDTAPSALECRFTDLPLTIDGVLDDAGWTAADQAAGLRLRWDRQHLYVAFTDAAGPSREPFTLRLAPPGADRGEFELHLTPANETRVRQVGAIDTAALDGAEVGLESAVATAADTGRRTIEMRVPWWVMAAVADRPEPADQWRLAFAGTDEPLTIRFAVPGDPPARPFGITAVVPVTTSRVAGSPDPPLPYTTMPAFPAAGISAPITVAHQPGSDRLLYVTEPFGYAPSSLMRMRDNPLGFEPEVLLPADDSTVHYGIAFHPRFAENGFVYIGCNGLAGPDGSVPADGRKRTRVIRYRLDPEPPYAFHRDSATAVIAWDSDGHNGGDLAFGPDGMLYVGSGDGTSDSDADMVGQDLSTLRAKILRIDVDRPDEGRGYSVPADNPFVGIAGVRPETWAYGLRQPWRVYVDRETGQ